jgi:DNA-binding GntR family transcriptional regulator
MMTEDNSYRGSGPLSDTLFQILRREILQGKLHPGAKLSELKLSEQHGLSRTPVREALHQLEMEGLIAMIPNRGAFVVGLSRQDIKDIFEMRRANEILAVTWAIDRIEKEELEHLGEAFEFMEFYTMREEADKMLNINREFHEQIYRAAHNRILLHTLTTQQYYLSQTREGSSYLKGSLTVVLEEHRKIYQAFLSKDPKAGAEAIAVHLDNAQKRAGNFS